jgi:transposase
VQNVVIWHEWMGLSADEIAAEYGLTLSEVYAALAYYYDHRTDIDDSIRGDQAFVEELRKATPSKLPEKLRG